MGGTNYCLIMSVRFLDRGPLKTHSCKFFPNCTRNHAITYTNDLFPDVLFILLSCASQVILLSATMPTDVLEVTKRFMRDPVRILVKKEELTLEGIKQFYINVEKEVKRSIFFIVIKFEFVEGRKGRKLKRIAEE